MIMMNTLHYYHRACSSTATTTKTLTTAGMHFFRTSNILTLLWKYAYFQFEILLDNYTRSFWSQTLFSGATQINVSFFLEYDLCLLIDYIVVHRSPKKFWMHNSKRYEKMTSKRNGSHCLSDCYFILKLSTTSHLYISRNYTTTYSSHGTRYSFVKIFSIFQNLHDRRILFLV